MLHNYYDLVYDGGTIEHIFDVKQALQNIMSLPRIGGRVIIHTMANNYFGHGFYQFSPELFYRAFSPENGYKVERVVLHADFEFARWYDIPDPTEVRGRIELANNRHGLMLFVSATRHAIVPVFEHPPQQSDYSALWQGSSSDIPSNTITPTGTLESSQRATLTALLKSRLPWLVRSKHALMWAMPAVPRLFNGIASRR